MLIHILCSSFLCFWINQIHPINWIANLLLIEIIYKVVSLVFAHLITDYQIILIIIVRPYIKFTPHLIRTMKEAKKNKIKEEVRHRKSSFSSQCYFWINRRNIYVSTGEETKLVLSCVNFEWIFYGKTQTIKFWIYLLDI